MISWINFVDTYLLMYFVHRFVSFGIELSFFFFFELIA